MNLNEAAKHIISSRLDLLIQVAVDEIVDYEFVVYFNGLDEAETRYDFEGATGATQAFVFTLVGEDGDEQLMELAREFIRDVVLPSMPEVTDLEQLEEVEDFYGDFSSDKFADEFRALVDRAVEALS